MTLPVYNKEGYSSLIRTLHVVLMMSIIIREAPLSSVHVHVYVCLSMCICYACMCQNVCQRGTSILYTVSILIERKQKKKIIISNLVCTQLESK